MAGICFEKIVNGDDRVEIVVYERGKYHKPLVVLGFTELRKIKKLLEERENDDKNMRQSAPQGL